MPIFNKQVLERESKLLMRIGYGQRSNGFGHPGSVMTRSVSFSKVAADGSRRRIENINNRK